MKVHKEKVREMRYTSPLEILKIIHLNSLTNICNCKNEGLSSIPVGEFFSGSSNTCQGNRPLEILKIIHLNSLTNIFIVLIVNVKG